ncbi:MAG: hypothetical protein HC800_22800 [Phormidesmis sp. RL_2_1]|nr:hypothetical protein [Phormidesmis sp. RL_2_1]
MGTRVDTDLRMSFGGVDSQAYIRLMRWQGQTGTATVQTHRGHHMLWFKTTHRFIPAGPSKLNSKGGDGKG